MPIVNFPEPIPERSTLARCFEIVRRTFGRTVSLDEAAPFILLQSPDKTTWKVTIEDDGSITTTAL